MAYDTLLQEARDGVAVITVNRPHVRNAVNGRVVEEMRAVFQQLRDDSSVGVVVFTGAGEKAFVAGCPADAARPSTVATTRDRELHSACGQHRRGLRVPGGRIGDHYMRSFERLGPSHAARRAATAVRWASRGSL
jgi:enoyl-CoA hydratase/carnithine racemase